MCVIEPDGFISVTFMQKVSSRYRDRYTFRLGVDQLTASSMCPCDVDTTSADCYTILLFTMEGYIWKVFDVCHHIHVHILLLYYCFVL